MRYIAETVIKYWEEIPLSIPDEEAYPILEKKLKENLPRDAIVTVKEGNVDVSLGKGCMRFPLECRVVTKARRLKKEMDRAYQDLVKYMNRAHAEDLRILEQYHQQILAHIKSWKERIQ